LADEIVKEKINNLNNELLQNNIDNNLECVNKRPNLGSEYRVIKKSIEALKGKTKAEHIQDFYTFLECNNKSKYRKKLKGIITPFSPYEKLLRMPFDEYMKRRYYFTNKTAEEIRHNINLRRQKRLSKEIEQEKREKEKYEKSKRMKQIMYERRKAEDERILMQMTIESEIEQGAENISWKMLRSMGYKDVYNHPKDTLNLSDLTNCNKEEVELFNRICHRKEMKETGILDNIRFNNLHINKEQEIRQRAEQIERQEEISKLNQMKRTISSHKRQIQKQLKVIYK